MSVSKLPSRILHLLPLAGKLAIAGGASLAIVSCSTSVPKSEVVVSVKDQRMGVYQEGQLIKQYVISTSKFGLGDQPGSCRTPLGKHEIIAKIGHGLPPGAVLKSRHWNGEVLKPNAPGRDPIVSRILWLRGMESSNRNAMKRYIYIHGTPEESRLGQPASYGCIRMGLTDVVDAFNTIGIGAKVEITKGPLPSGKKIKPKKAPEEELPVEAPQPIAPEPEQVIAATPPPATAPAEASATTAPATASSFFVTRLWKRSPDKVAAESADSDNKVGPEKVEPAAAEEPAAQATAVTTEKKSNKLGIKNKLWKRSEEKTAARNSTVASVNRHHS